ncbi:MAG: sorbosone dehydrogenase, partial [Meiothermus sp.]
MNTPNDKQIPDPTVPGSANYGCSSATKAAPPLFTTVAHAAPLGMAWGTDSNFPAEYKNSLYIAEHGSWNTDNPETYRDCKVDRVVLEGGRPTKVEAFATFKRGVNEKCGDAWGRPAGIVF